jgi:hypothetical protein
VRELCELVSSQVWPTMRYEKGPTNLDDRAVLSTDEGDRSGRVDALRDRGSYNYRQGEHSVRTAASRDRNGPFFRDRDRMQGG